ncbi:MAG: extracellular solute-binding protein family 1 [Paenibacillus sp.]|nr:extracellular solute-binding protein family 1 [Paenibacillus sp.]
MMNGNWKRAVALPLVAMLAATLAACGSNESGGNAAEDTTEGEKVTLRFSWWGSEVRHKALLEAIDMYTEANPNVVIEPEYSGFEGYYQKLVTQFAGGTAPDLTPLSVDWIEELAVKGDLVLDLNTLKDYLNLDAFDKEFLDSYTMYDGKLVGLPMGANGMVTLYNKAFFERFDIAEDTVWDWDKIHTIGKQVHEKDANAYLLGMFDHRIFLQPFVNQLTGNQWIQDDKTVGFAEEDVAKAFSYYQQLIADGVIQPVAESSLYPDMADNLQWQNGNIGMMFTLASTIAKVKTFTPEVDAAMFPVPSGAKTSAVLVNPSNPLAINKKTKHPEEAAKFASWLLTSEEASLVLKDVFSVPVVKANADRLVEKSLIDPTVAKAVDLALSNPGEPVNGLSSNQELNQISQDILEKVAFGKLTPDAAASELTERLKDKLSLIK